ncbi:hypothetical protein NXX85_20985 [Bacteroides caccae]|jgi:hypothetical protein|nr:hypothetical protein [Bacteroides caccae]UVP81658.1 hypothetical protein NXX85_20985 [Bacteroides caccae]UVQ06504.1 hypothetical protein NXW85_21115 [Bacteroides caccae]
MSEDEFEDGYQDADDINSVEDNADLIVYSRDWTVATILNQIE